MITHIMADNVDTLLNMEGFSVSNKVDNGKSLAHLAAAHQANSVLLHLALNHPDVLDALDDEGASAIQMVARSGNVQYCAFLSYLGANPYKKDKFGMSAIYILQAMGLPTHDVERYFGGLKKNFSMVE